MTTKSKDTKLKMLIFVNLYNLLNVFLLDCLKITILLVAICCFY